MTTFLASTFTGIIFFTLGWFLSRSIQKDKIATFLQDQEKKNKIHLQQPLKIRETER